MSKKTMSYIRVSMGTALILTLSSIGLYTTNVWGKGLSQLVVLAFGGVAYYTAMKTVQIN